MKTILKTLGYSTAVALTLGAMSAPASAVALKEIFSLGGGAFAQDHIYRIDLSTNTVTDLGSGGVGFPTNLVGKGVRALKTTSSGLSILPRFFLLPRQIATAMDDGEDLQLVGL